MRNNHTRTRSVSNRYAEAVRRRSVETSVNQLDAKAHDLIVAGDALLAANDRENRLQNYREAFAILEKLAAIDPNNAQRQRNLLAIHCKIGDVLLTQGNYNAALDEYRKSISIAE